MSTEPSAQGSVFLQRLVAQFPFPVRAVQSDGGSEFLQAFQVAAAALHLPHYFNRPNDPQGNGRIERSFRTDAAARRSGGARRAHGEEEFYQSLP